MSQHPGAVTNLEKLRGHMNSLAYNGKSFSQRESDGYVNLGQLCATHGKKQADWGRLKSSNAYLEALSGFTGIPTTDLMTVQNGNATWGHPLVAIEVARWISPAFGVWLDVALLRQSSGLMDIFGASFKTKEQQDNSGFIYLAQASQTQWCKIGMSKQPYKRMQSLQTGNPLEIILIHRIYTFDAIALEKSLHEYFDAYRVRGEWFDLPIECIQEFPIVANQLDAVIEQVCLPQ